MLKIGDQAPDFTLLNQDGEEVSLSQYRGKKVVLYFYPKDNTAGCTKQACGFTALKDEYASKGAVVLGVSKDSVKSHKNFETKQNLDIMLISDPDLKAIQSYDVWKEKKMCGKTYMGVVRSTFVINEEGVITHIMNNVKAANNPQDVLELL